MPTVTRSQPSSSSLPAAHPTSCQLHCQRQQQPSSPAGVPELPCRDRGRARRARHVCGVQVAAAAARSSSGDNPGVGQVRHLRLCCCEWRLCHPSRCHTGSQRAGNPSASPLLTASAPVRQHSLKLSLLVLPRHRPADSQPARGYICEDICRGFLARQDAARLQLARRVQQDLRRRLLGRAFSGWRRRSAARVRLAARCQEVSERPHLAAVRLAPNQLRALRVEAGKDGVATAHRWGPATGCPADRGPLLHAGVTCLLALCCSSHIAPSTLPLDLITGLIRLAELCRAVRLLSRALAAWVVAVASGRVVPSLRQGERPRGCRPNACR